MRPPRGAALPHRDLGQALHRRAHQVVGARPQRLPRDIGDGQQQDQVQPRVPATTTLQRGKFIEFETTTDFEVTGDGPFLLAQFMVGQGYSNPTPQTGAPGDPSLALAVPVEQYRTSYLFLAPETFQQSYVNVIAPLGATVKLDARRSTRASSCRSAPSISPIGCSQS